MVEHCERVKTSKEALCAAHRHEWNSAHAAGQTRSAFLNAAQPRIATEGTEPEDLPSLSRSPDPDAAGGSLLGT